jgi:outer membrane protein assembly factor BamB
MWKSEQLNGFPKDISFGDVTGDGNLNIIAATYDRVQILEASNGSKTWYYSVAGTIATVGCADLDDDSIMDTLAGGGAEFSGSNPSKSIWALKTVESSLLWEFNFGEYGNELAIDDLNDDQYLDVVTVCSVDDKAWAINGEDGTELWNWTGTQNLYAVTTGDFDNDGQIDVAVAGNDDRVTALYGNNGSVIWQFNTGNQIYRKCLQASDLNNDGNIDVIAGCDDSYVYAINGLNGNQLWSYYAGASVNEVELAQMNASGPLDIVAAVGIGSNGEKVIVIDGLNGSILWSYNAPEAVEHVEVFDVNDDSIPDVAAAITPYSPTQVIMIDGSTHSSLWTKSMPIASNVHSLAHGDLDGNGIPDVVVPGRSSDKKIYALNGSNGNELWDYQTGGEINSVAVADIDFDNQLDVIAGSDDQIVYVLYGNNGSSFWTYSTADDVMHIQLGDISGDGMPNIACVTFGSDGVVYAFSSFSPAENIPPYIPSNPSPEDGAMYVDPDADLSWTGGDPNPGDTVTYNVYFGTSSPPPKVVTNQTGTSYDPGTMNYYTKYYWKIVAWDNNNAYSESPIWNFTTEGPNNPPNEPSDPDPDSGEPDVDIDADLSWTGGDPDPGDTITYDVYFGPDSDPPKVSNKQSDTTYDPGKMDFLTVYYWKIVSWDNHGASNSGLIWHFTTRDNNPPVTPSDPEPEDGATNVDINAFLSWSCSDPDGDEVTFNVYFEADDPTPDVLVSENQSGPTYDPGTMEYNTHYYWKIVAWDEYGASTEGPIWDFTTGTEPNDQPYIPSDPNPENGSTDIDVDTDISWTGGDPDVGDTVVYDIYFEADDSTPDTKIADDISENTFDPGTLEYGTIYYWQIIAKDNHGASSMSPVWHFSTKENTPPNDPSINGPSSGKPGIEYNYKFKTIDPEGHNVFYYIDWGDDTIEEWLGPYSSGMEVTINHSWENRDTYVLKAKTKDIYNAESNFSEYEVTIPKNRLSYHPLIIRLFERFPNAIIILRIITNHIINRIINREIY